MANRLRSQGIGAALTSALLLGLIPIFGKQALLMGYSPLSVVTIRSGLAATLLFGFMLFQRRYFYIYPVGLIGCALAGFINGVGSILYYFALDRIGAGVGQLLYSFYPLFVAGWLLLDRHAISRLTILRLGLALPGVILLIQTGHDRVDLLGAACMLGSAIFYALHLIVNQRVLYEVPAPTVTFYTLLSMSLTVLSAYLIFDRQIPPSTASPWPLLGMGFVTFLSRLTLFLGVKKLGGMQTALLGLGELLVTIVLAQIWLQETLSIPQSIGALFVGASVLLVGLEKYTPAKRHQTGWLAWLNPPKIPTTDLPWQN
jgi:drug/metabolite transporter (DMT)-like permease